MEKSDNTPHEHVLDRLRKIAALADKGCQGESAAAAAILEKELERYGLSMDDILDDRRIKRTFKFANYDELKLLAEIVVNVAGSKSEAYDKMTFNKSRKEAYVSLTNIEYADVEAMFAHYRRIYAAEMKKELEKAKDAFNLAFIAKYDLWDRDIDKAGGENGLSREDMERLMRAKNAMRSMKGDPYRKMIEC